MIEAKVEQAPTAAVTVGMGDAVTIDLTAALRRLQPGRWETLAIPLRCLAGTSLDLKSVSQPFSLSTAGALQIALFEVRIGTAPIKPISC